MIAYKICICFLAVSQGMPADRILAMNDADEPEGKEAAVSEDGVGFLTGLGVAAYYAAKAAAIGGAIYGTQRAASEIASASARSKAKGNLAKKYCAGSDLTEGCCCVLVGKWLASRSCAYCPNGHQMVTPGTCPSSRQCKWANPEHPFNGHNVHDYDFEKDPLGLGIKDPHGYETNPETGKLEYVGRA